MDPMGTSISFRIFGISLPRESLRPGRRRGRGWRGAVNICGTYVQLIVYIVGTYFFSEG